MFEDQRTAPKFNVYLHRKNRNSYGRGFFGGRFALFETTFCVSLQCRVDDLMFSFPFPPIAFCTYTIMYHIELSVGKRRMYEKADAKNHFFPLWQECAVFTYLLGSHRRRNILDYFEWSFLRPMSYDLQ